MNEWQCLQDDIADWQTMQFGHSYSPVPTLHHLREEVPELIAAWESKDPEAILEFADCMMLLMGAGARAGIDMPTLFNAVHTKLVINKSRRWGEPDENGVVKHVEPEP